ncbi:MAG TPA: hypothetical protein VGP96_13790 [Candidatus Dormibacteraeota bacterium]|jgi:hypothetical protein|nr:hypothetical protein [Candidatus Dormibacteraeota bacterium]
MQVTVPIPTFSRRSVPVPSLSRKELMFIGGAVALGVVDVLSAPVAAVVAAAPLLRKAVGGIAGSAEAAHSNGAAPRRRGQARRTATTRGRSTARSGATTAARSSRRSTGDAATTTVGTA